MCVVWGAAMIVLNLNDIVRVHLTPAGVSAWGPGGGPVVTTELWEVMRRLGPGTLIGSPQLIVGNRIEVLTSYGVGPG